MNAVDDFQVDVPSRKVLYETLNRAFQNSEVRNDPFAHWCITDLFPSALIQRLAHIPLTSPPKLNVSGTREINNDKRTYLAGPMLDRFPELGSLANLFQHPETVDLISSCFGADLAGTSLRLEYCQDQDGFLLEPHTDIGVKRFSMLIYLPTREAHRDLGTDLFYANGQHAGRAPFLSNSALVFVPSDTSFHGFMRRPILGTRKSLILNYVTADWRAREQLAFPNQTV